MNGPIVRVPAQDMVDLIALLADAPWTAPKMHLFSNNITPNRNNVLADFTAVIASGVVAQTVTYGTPFLDQNGLATVSGGELSFQQTGATGDLAYGCFLTDTAGATLLWSSRFVPAPFPFVVSGDTLKFVFKQTLDDGLVQRSDVP